MVMCRKGDQDAKSKRVSLRLVFILIEINFKVVDTYALESRSTRHLLFWLIQVKIQ